MTKYTRVPDGDARLIAVREGPIRRLMASHTEESVCSFLGRVMIQALQSDPRPKTYSMGDEPAIMSTGDSWVSTYENPRLFIWTGRRIVSMPPDSKDTRRYLTYGEIGEDCPEFEKVYEPSEKVTILVAYNVALSWPDILPEHLGGQVYDIMQYNRQTARLGNYYDGLQLGTKMPTNARKVLVWRNKRLHAASSFLPLEKDFIAKDYEKWLKGKSSKNAK